MHRYEAAVLKALKPGKPLSLEELTKEAKLERGEALWAIENLSSRSAIEVRKEELEEVELSEEGEFYAKSKMPEESLLEACKKGNVRIGTLASKEEQIGLQWAKKKNLITINGGLIQLTQEGKNALSKGVEEGNALRALDNSPEKYFDLINSDKEAILNLLKRGLITLKKKNEVRSVKITEKGIKELGGESKAESIDALSKNIIMNKSWVGKEFKSYDVNVAVEREQAAVRHPLRKTIRELKEAYLSLGFKEVSGPIILPAFWSFDSLFMPQDHPAREIQDAFYLSNPAKIKVDSKEYMSKVKKAHLESWGGEWSEEVAEQAMLRTHTTTVSAMRINEVIANHLSKKVKYDFPIKLFSVGRCFRNENIDYRHLTDFYQHDGIVIGNNLTFANLFEILISIYDKFDIELKFKPAYFPFVEPGVEFYAFYKKTNEWIEMGGAGMIRAEVSGAPRKNITVLAWGPGVERLMLVKDPSIESITELYNGDIGWLRERRMI